MTQALWYSVRLQLTFWQYLRRSISCFWTEADHKWLKPWVPETTERKPGVRENYCTSNVLKNFPNPLIVSVPLQKEKKKNNKKTTTKKKTQRITGWRRRLIIVRRSHSCIHYKELNQTLPEYLTSSSPELDTVPIQCPPWGRLKEGLGRGSESVLNMFEGQLLCNSLAPKQITGHWP